MGGGGGSGRGGKQGCTVSHRREQELFRHAEADADIDTRLLSRLFALHHHAHAQVLHLVRSDARVRPGGGEASAVCAQNGGWVGGWVDG